MTERRAASGSLQAPYLGNSPSYRLQAASRPLKALPLAAKEGYVPFFDVVPPLAPTHCQISTLDRSRRKLVSTSICCMTVSLNAIDSFHSFFFFPCYSIFSICDSFVLFRFCLVLWVLGIQFDL